MAVPTSPRAVSRMRSSDGLSGAAEPSMDSMVRQPERMRACIFSAVRLVNRQEWIFRGARQRRAREPRGSKRRRFGAGSAGAHVAGRRGGAPRTRTQYCNRSWRKKGPLIIGVGIDRSDLHARRVRCRADLNRARRRLALVWLQQVLPRCSHAGPRFPCRASCPKRLAGESSGSCVHRKLCGGSGPLLRLAGLAWDISLRHGIRVPVLWGVHHRMVHRRPRP